MSMFHRKSKWQRVAEQVVAGSAVKSGLTAVAGLIGVTAVSAAVSSWRRKNDES